MYVCMYVIRCSYGPAAAACLPFSAFLPSQVDLVEVEGPMVFIHLHGAFWHNRADGGPGGGSGSEGWLLYGCYRATIWLFWGFAA